MTESVSDSLKTSQTLDIETLRAETPGVANRLHLNNAGSALMPSKVLDTTVDYLKLEAEIGGYEAEQTRHSEIEGFYDSVAQLLNCQPEEVAYTENATRAWDMAFYSLPLSDGDKILTTASEYASNYIAFLQARRMRHIKIEVVPNDRFGQIDIDALESMIDSKVRLIALTHVPTNGGLVNPVEAVGRLARKHRIMFLLDACQSVGQMEVDVKKIDCDFLSATGRKFLRGPRGTGFLYVRKERISELEPIFLDLHAAEWTSKEQYEIRQDARRFENWEQNYAGKLGLAAAISYATQIGIASIHTRIVELATLLRQELATINGVKVTDMGETKCGIVTFVHDKIDSRALVQRLYKDAINISASSVSSTRLDMEARKLPTLARASVHCYNTEAEVQRFCQCLRNV